MSTFFFLSSCVGGVQAAAETSTAAAHHSRAARQGIASRPRRLCEGRRGDGKGAGRAAVARSERTSQRDESASKEGSI